MKIKNIFFILIVFFVFLPDVYAQTQNSIRIRIIQDVASVNIKVVGEYVVRDEDKGCVFKKGKDLVTTVTVYSDGFSMGEELFRVKALRISPEDANPLVINGRRFTGDVVFLLDSKKAALTAVNHTDIENYLKGILYHEVSHYWPIEVLKAQAIASRSFALYQVRKNSARDFDVTNDIYSQVYGGRTSERHRTNLAVEATEGLVLIYNEEIIPAYFHSTCGGYTEDASALWDLDTFILKGLKCGFCRNSPHFKWHKVITVEEVREKLQNARPEIKEINDIEVVTRDETSGRVRTIEIVSNAGNQEISAKEFRDILGPNMIRSTNFEVRLVDNDFVFNGLGWGHGVGMCQWGAYFMAKQGYKCEDILKLYYPGVVLKRADEIFSVR